jgi:hypothetical protein
MPSLSGLVAEVGRLAPRRGEERPVRSSLDRCISSQPYSPKCLEEGFSEVHIHDPA